MVTLLGINGYELQATDAKSWLNSSTLPTVACQKKR
jgi:hypothetical protein